MPPLGRKHAGRPALSIERQNANNLYKDRLRTLEIAARQQLSEGTADASADSSLQRFFNRQLEVWEDARQHFHDLRNVKTRELACGEITLKLQFNPARIVSTGANIDRKTIAERPCFLCEQNRPKEQMQKQVDKNFTLLITIPLSCRNTILYRCAHTARRASA